MKKFPTTDEILAWVAEHPTRASKRDIARAFGIKGQDRIELKRMLRDLEADGKLERRGKRHHEPGTLPPVSVLEIEGPNADGDLEARPAAWEGEEPAPRILMIEREGGPALGRGDRVLARLTPVDAEPQAYEARMIRRLGENKRRVLGVFRQGAEGGRIVPIDKGADLEWLVPAGAEAGARDGELVEAEQAPGRPRLGLPRARVVARLGDPHAPRAFSLIAIHRHGIPDQFPDDVLAEAEAATPAELDGREDLRDVPFITIDPADARDHDDAVWAEPDPSADNPGGHVVWVAIADVAHYVRPGSALDREARRRGNSTYFPDRVVPMLPDRLSGDLCSLHEGAQRPCIAVRMVLDAEGNKISHRFTRGFMRTHAALNYAEIQAARDGAPNDHCAPLMEGVITPLYAAYEAARRARSRRQPLELDLPERSIRLSDDGKVVAIEVAERLDSHRLIEEFMILANVAAAEELERLRRPLLYRVHEEPSPEKLEALREVAQASGFTLAKGQVLKPRHLNALLAQAEGTEADELMNLSTLRSMTQAYYFPENFGHFGLALGRYAHFTSPIRRYADLIVHRALITAHGWGDDGLSPAELDMLEATAEHISQTERRSMAAERDTTDRYLAAYLAERIGAEFEGRISGVQRFGLFVKLDETGADGLVPVARIGDEFFRYDPEGEALIGADTGQRLELGQRVTVRLQEAVPVTGGLMLDLVAVEGKALPKPRASGRRAARRKPGQARHKAAKSRQKAGRKRRG